MRDETAHVAGDKAAVFADAQPARRAASHPDAEDGVIAIRFRQGREGLIHPAILTIRPARLGDWLFDRKARNVQGGDADVAALATKQRLGHHRAARWKTCAVERGGQQIRMAGVQLNVWISVGGTSAQDGLIDEAWTHPKIAKIDRFSI